MIVVSCMHPPAGWPYTLLHTGHDVVFLLQVDVGLKQLSCHFMGGGVRTQHGLEAFAEANALQLKAYKAVKMRRHRRQRQQQIPEAQTLFTTEFTTGILQVRNSRLRRQVHNKLLAWHGLIVVEHRASPNVGIAHTDKASVCRLGWEWLG